MIPMMPKVVEPESTVISMVHQDIAEEKPGLVPNLFKIKAGSMDKPSVNHIGVAKHFVYLDGDRGSLPVRDASYEVARSIVEDYIGAQMCVSEGCYPGLFWVPGKLTLKEIEVHSEYGPLLAQAKISHQRWMLKMTQIADDDFSRYQKHNVVSDFQRRIAEILKLKPEQHPWMNVANTLESLTCPSCQSLAVKGTVVCKSCKYVFDKEKHKELTYAQ